MRSIPILVGFLLVATLCAYAGDSLAEVRIAWIGNATDPADASVLGGMQDAARELSEVKPSERRIQIVDFSMHSITPQQQCEAIRRAVLADCMAIAIDCVDGEVLTSAINAATLAGVSVLTVLNDAPSSHRRAAFVIDYPALGAAFSDSLPRKVAANPASLVLLVGPDTSPALLDATKTALVTRPDWHLAALISAQRGESASVALTHYFSDERNRPASVLCLTRDPVLYAPTPHSWGTAQPRLLGLGWSPAAAMSLKNKVFMTLVDTDAYLAGQRVVTKIVKHPSSNPDSEPAVTPIPLRVMIPRDSDDLLEAWRRWSE
ncbi:MAG: hypothetical protein SFY80_04595 [Verrucomicrobiota bacterium]|nr:hypothetical protein [Verrucomicrobiota bacterium]